jgi:predicted secreted protein
MKRIIILALSLILILSDELRTINLDDITDTENTLLPIKTQTKIIFEVKGNPTTGYIWTVGNRDELKANGLIVPLELDERGAGKYYSNQSGALGGGGIYQFTFETSEKEGHEVIKFVNKRPWEQDAHTIKNINVQVSNPQQAADL